MVSTTVHAALDTFADYSVLPTQARIRGGGIVPPAVFLPGVTYTDDAVELAFCDAPAPVNAFRFRSSPCRFDSRLPPTHRFQLAIRDLLSDFLLNIEEDRLGEVWLILSRRPSRSGQPA
jgi:hypothetical protein